MNSESKGWCKLGVSPVIIKALLEQKFYSPTVIQALVLPAAILGNRDILCAAETGSGKTLAFGIPVLNGILELMEKKGKRLLGSKGKFKEANKDTSNYFDSINSNEFNGDKSMVIEFNDLSTIPGSSDNIINEAFNNINTLKPLYALILTPTRELAFQVQNHLLNIAKFTKIKIAVLVGGMATMKQERILNKGPEIVIATPGRLWELLVNRNSHLSQIDSIRYLVIDETDRMLEKCHFMELYNILDKVNANEYKVARRQNFVLSATLTFVHDIPNYLHRKKVQNSKNKILKVTSTQKLQKVIEFLKIKNFKIIDITKITGTAENLTESRITCTIDHKDYYLYYLLKRYHGRTLVFCNSIGCVKRLSTLFGILKCKPLSLYASMPQQQRLTNLERFYTDKHGLLIATDIAARGLDIPCIQHVIHYQVPRTTESYIHRCGRTARAKKKGITILLMEPSEKHLYNRLCKTLNRTTDLPVFPVIDHLIFAVKERINIAREIDKLELRSKRDHSQKAWLEKAAKDMDILLDNEELSFVKVKDETYYKRLLKTKKNQLESLLKKPLFPNNFSGKYRDTLKISFNQSPEKAIDVIEKYIEDCSKLKRK